MESSPGVEHLEIMDNTDIQLSHSGLSDSDGRLSGFKMSSSGEGNANVVRDFDVFRGSGIDPSDGLSEEIWSIEKSQDKSSTFCIGVARFWHVARILNSVWLDRDR